MDDIESFARRRRGRPSRGNRAQIAVRPTPELKERYEQEAAALGIPLSSWCIKVLNEHLGLDIPSYVQEDIRVAAERQELELDGMEDLPTRRVS